jgi:hypothetical protein
VGERALRDLIAVDVGPVPRVAVAEHEFMVFDGNRGVIAGDLAPGEAQVVRLAPADFELRLGNRHNAPAKRIGDFQTSVRHSGEYY